MLEASQPHSLCPSDTIETQHLGIRKMTGKHCSEGAHVRDVTAIAVLTALSIRLSLYDNFEDGVALVAMLSKMSGEG